MTTTTNYPARQSFGALRSRCALHAVVALTCASFYFLASAASALDEEDDQSPDTDEEIKGQITAVQNAPIPKTEFEIQGEMTEIKANKAGTENRVKVLRRRSKNLKDNMAKPENQPAALKAQIVGFRDAFDAKAKGPAMPERKDVVEALRPLANFSGLEIDLEDSPLSVAEKDTAKAIPTLRTAARRLMLIETLKPADLLKFREEMLNDDRLKVYDAAIDLYAKQRAQAAKNAEEVAARSEMLAKAYGDRLNKLSEALAGQTKNQAKVVNALVEKLPMILGILCALFAVIILLVRFFPDATQIEWVGSSQVIQLLTVVTLLLIILCLAVTDILKENIIGTLLGGIGGYVLSQGIGRAAARAATRTQEAAQAQNAIP